MTKFEFQGTGRTVGDGGIKKLGALALAVAGGVVAYKALGSAASTAGDLLVIVPVTLGGLLAGALVMFVALKGRRPRRAAGDGQPARQLWAANPHASPLPQRAAPAIAPVTVINNFGPDLLAEAARVLYATQQQAQAAPVIIPSEREELPR